MSQIVNILLAGVPTLGAIGGSLAWVWRQVDKRITALDAKLTECEARENVARDRRAKMWRVIDMLLDAIEDKDPQHHRLVRVRSLLGELREDEIKIMEPAE